MNVTRRLDNNNIKKYIYDCLTAAVASRVSPENNNLRLTSSCMHGNNNNNNFVGRFCDAGCNRVVGVASFDGSVGSMGARALEKCEY